MVRRHGWGGNPPADEHEARGRIVEAAIRCVDRDGPDDFSLSKVAIELAVTRQTVYRYFESTDELFIAVSWHSVDDFLDELTDHVAPLTEPDAWLVEALASTLEWLPQRPFLLLPLGPRRSGLPIRGVVSPGAIVGARVLFTRSSVDWAAAGFDDDLLDETIEVVLRLIQSMLIEPQTNLRRGPELRGWLDRWLGAAIREAQWNRAKSPQLEGTA